MTAHDPSKPGYAPSPRPPMQGRAWLLIAALGFLMALIAGANLLSRKAEPAMEVRNIQVAGHAFRVEMATTYEQREQGLMFREDVPAGTGMLFVFPEDKRLTFWMRNTRVPLDILFFDHQGKLLNIEAAVPCPDDEPNCPIYPSSGLARYVLEIGAGEAARLGLNPGDKIGMETPGSAEPIPPAKQSE